MNVRLLGTSGAAGWPQAFCRCASCRGERAAGRARGPSAALLGDRVLVDCSASTPQAAIRAGVDLADVALLLITDAERFSPDVLAARAQVTDAPLTVLGAEPGAVGPEVVEGYRVRALAGSEADSAHVYDVTGPDGERVLCALSTSTLTGANVEAASGAVYDVVLLELALGVETFAEQVRRLRTVGAITSDTDVVALGLTHEHPSTAELQRRLAACGARVVDDGTVLGDAPTDEQSAARTLVIGGARSGKSAEAERALLAAPAVTYVATSYPRSDDPEWRERVRAHVDRRPGHWATVESLDLVGLLGGDDPSALLIDCLTLWLTRVIDAHEAWDVDAPDHAAAWEGVRAEMDALVEAWRRTSRRVVAVTNEIGQGVVPATASGRMFRDAMGHLNAAIAAATEDVRLVVAGRVVAL